MIEKQAEETPVDRIVSHETVTVAEWNRHWREAIRLTEQEINQLSREGLTREDEAIWFREDMVKHMKTKLVGG